MWVAGSLCRLAALWPSSLLSMGFPVAQPQPGFECSAYDLQVRGQLKFFADQLAARAPTASVAATAAASAGWHSSKPLPGAFQITCWQRRTFAVPKPTPGKPLHLSLWQQDAPHCSTPRSLKIARQFYLSAQPGLLRHNPNVVLCVFAQF